MEQPNRKTRRRFKLWHGIVGLLLLLFVLFRVTGSLKLKKQIEALRNQGYPVTLEELDRWYNIPEGAKNAADIYKSAFSNYVEWDKEEMRALPIVGKASLPARNEPLDDPNLQLVDKFLSDNRKTLALLHEAASIEHSRYPIDLTKGQAASMERPGTPAKWVTDLRTSAQLLRLETLSLCEHQQAEKALESIRANFALAKFISAPLLFHRLIHNSFQSRTYRIIERILNRMQLTDEQLVSLSLWIKESFNDEGYTKALVGERCIGLDVFQGSVGQINDKIGSEGGPSILFFTIFKMLGLHYRDAVSYISLMQEHIDAMELPSDERLLVFDSIQEDVNSGKRGGLLTRLIWPSQARMLQLDTRCTAEALVAQTAIAIERYRRVEGHLPESLENLVPAYMESVPKDPFDGRNLRYISRESEFVVYSINDDLTDNGGAEQDSEKRDRRGKPLSWDITFIIER
jgi:hypothetical protein